MKENIKKNCVFLIIFLYLYYLNVNCYNNIKIIINELLTINYIIN
jgi:hypothetical protein